MASPFNQYDWYWVVIGFPGQVFASRLGTLISDTDATYVAWLSADGGNQAPVVSYDGLLGIMNNFAKVNYTPATKNIVLSGTPITLTNPMGNFYEFNNNSGTVYKIILPNACMPNSIPVAVPVVLRHNGTGTYCEFYLNDGVTLLTRVYAKEAVTITLKQNTFVVGAWDVQRVGDVFQAANNTLSGTNTFTGNVNINSPQAIFNNAIIKINGVNAAQAGIDINSWDNSSNGPSINVRHSRGTFTVPAPVQVGDLLGSITFGGDDGFGLISSAGIKATVDAAPASGHIASIISFSTDNGTALVERMRLWSSGGLVLSTTIGSDPGAGLMRLGASPAAASNDNTVATTSWVRAVQLPAFKATLAADQTGIATSTFTKINFNTAGINIGNHFNTGNGRWTPPAGPILIGATLFAGAGASSNINVLIYKNGAIVNFAGTNSGPNTIANGSVQVVDVASGTDYYECWILHNGAAAATVYAGAQTWYWGVRV